MAIKGKGKTKPKGTARAPRMQPVPVKKPLFQRTWVRVTAGFIAGVFLMSMTWWVWEGLDKNRNQAESQERSTQQREAMQAWKLSLEGAISEIGLLQGPLTPTVGESIEPALRALERGKQPAATSGGDLTSTADGLGDAAEQIEGYDLSGEIRDRGFDRGQSEAILGAQAEIAAGLRSLEVAARLAALAMHAPGEQEALVAAATEAAETGRSLLDRGWQKYSNALIAAGVGSGAPTGLPQDLGS
jgi:hypothetical protein